jgi:spore coat protein H
MAAEVGSRPQKKAKAAKPAPGSEIFDHPTVLDFQVNLGETNLHALRRHPREYTPATVVVNGKEYHQVGVKLKGAAGSFRPVDDEPALTLHFSKWIKDQRVFGLRRLHLNNSVQDDSRMNEYIASGLFREAGVPTPRVAWATVRINERDLGLYVLKEAFETEFLRMFFGSDNGNLYEGGFVKDLEQGLAKESGKGPDDRSDVQALCTAMRDKDTTNRWEKLNRLLDVDLFTTYSALSVMLADWDGYPMNRNNYRVYFRPRDGKAVFMPHGMDQLFQRTDYELDASWTGSLAWALFDTPQGQALYQQRCREVFTNVFRLERITNTIAQVTAVLQKADHTITNSASDLTYRVERRYRSLCRDEFLKPARAGQAPGTDGTTGTAPQ